MLTRRGADFGENWVTPSIYNFFNLTLHTNVRIATSLLTLKLVFGLEFRQHLLKQIGT